MAEVREMALVLMVLVAWAWPPALPHPTLDRLPSPPTTTRPVQQAEQKDGDSGDGWSLWDTVLRVDQLLQRPNDYNALMLESGEHEDELSRLLYKRQEWQRQQERYIGHAKVGSGTPEQSTIIDNNPHVTRQVRYIDARRPSVYWV